MKKSILIITILASIVFITACKNGVETEIKSNNKSKNTLTNLMLGGGVPYDEGSIYYRAITTTGNNDSSCYYWATGQFYKTSDLNPKDVENVGDLYIGAIKVNIMDTALYGKHYTYNFTSLDAKNQINAGQFGTGTAFSITGGGSFDPCSTEFYIPEELYLAPMTPCACGRSVSGLPTLSKTNPSVAINWITDPNNSNVAVVFFYDGPTSKRLNANLSDQSFERTKIVSDNGNYAISSSDLIDFPVGSVVEIYVGRSSEGDMTSKGKNIHITGYTYAKETYEIVQ
ncbi:MAG: hypothetical protein NTU43_09635 [Bacteroidetes bacterium]|nr:hypothetical protein [Bacteroidota bacterium]